MMMEGEVAKEKVMEALREVYDPEIPINIVDLGLVDEVRVEGPKVVVRLIPTAPGCPMLGFIAQKAKEAVASIPGVEGAEVELVLDKPWTPDRLTEEGKKRFREITGF